MTPQSKIGEIMDVLVSTDGKVNALIIGVGGFLGMGEKDVARALQRGQAHTPRMARSISRSTPRRMR